MGRSSRRCHGAAGYTPPVTFPPGIGAECCFVRFQAFTRLAKDWAGSNSRDNLMLIGQRPISVARLILPDPINRGLRKLQLLCYPGEGMLHRVLLPQLDDPERLRETWRRLKVRLVLVVLQSIRRPPQRMTQVSLLCQLCLGLLYLSDRFFTSSAKASTFSRRRLPKCYPKIRHSRSFVRFPPSSRPDPGVVFCHSSD